MFLSVVNEQNVNFIPVFTIDYFDLIVFAADCFMS